ncbi:MAG: hypothetical protein ACU84H_04145 [Gammaproteobacteria bacterium]
MIYSVGMGVGKVAGIKLDKASGDLKVAFVLDNMTTTFQPLFGPKGKRGLLLTNMRLNAPGSRSSPSSSQRTTRSSPPGAI